MTRYEYSPFINSFPFGFIVLGPISVILFLIAIGGMQLIATQLGWDAPLSKLISTDLWPLVFSPPALLFCIYSANVGIKNAKAKKENTKQ